MNLLSQLNKLNIAYVHTGSFNDKATYPELNNETMSEFIGQYYQGTLVACGSYSPEEAALQIQAKYFDLIALGRLFIANPDLITRLQTNQELKTYDAKMLDTLY